MSPVSLAELSVKDSRQVVFEPEEKSLREENRMERDEDGDENKEGQQGEEEMATSRSETASASSSNKTLSKITLSFQDYQRIANMIVYHLRSLESEDDSGSHALFSLLSSLLFISHLFAVQHFLKTN